MIHLTGKHFAVALLFLIACSSRGEPEVTEGRIPNAAVVDAGTDTDATRPPEPSLPVWTSTRRRIEVSSFGYWQGSTAYAKDRADLSQEQLTALEGLRTIDPPPGLGADFTSYQIRIVDADGSVRRYRAADGNIRDSDESANAEHWPTIDIATLQPFLATFACLAARSTNAVTRSTDTPAAPGTVDGGSPVALPRDTGCINGVFVPYKCADAFFTFDVAETANYEFSTGGCLETLSLRVYGSDRTTLVAESTPGTGDTCAVLSHVFAPGHYVLEFSKTNAGGCATDGNAGDASLQFRIVK